MEGEGGIVSLDLETAKSFAENDKEQHRLCMALSGFMYVPGKKSSTHLGESLLTVIRSYSPHSIGRLHAAFSKCINVIMKYFAALVSISGYTVLGKQSFIIHCNFKPFAVNGNDFFKFNIIVDDNVPDKTFYNPNPTAVNAYHYGKVTGFQLQNMGVDPDILTNMDIESYTSLRMCIYEAALLAKDVENDVLEALVNYLKSKGIRIKPFYVRETPSTITIGKKSLKCDYTILDCSTILTNQSVKSHFVLLSEDSLINTGTERNITIGFNYTDTKYDKGGRIIEKLMKYVSSDNVKISPSPDSVAFYYELLESSYLSQEISFKVSKKYRKIVEMLGDEYQFFYYYLSVAGRDVPLVTHAAYEKRMRILSAKSGHRYKSNLLMLLDNEEMFESFIPLSEAIRRQ